MEKPKKKLKKQRLFERRFNQFFPCGVVLNADLSYLADEEFKKVKIKKTWEVITTLERVAQETHVGETYRIDNWKNLRINLKFEDEQCKKIKSYKIIDRDSLKSEAVSVAITTGTLVKLKQKMKENNINSVGEQIRQLIYKGL